MALSATGNILTTPATLTGLVAWFRSDLGITLAQGPVVATGTTPPAVTFSGTPSSSSNTIVLTCTGAGTNTTATFAFTLNGVAQAPFTAAPTVVLPGTGITATLSVGPYTNTPSADTYTSVVVVSAWGDQSGNGHNAAQATALQQFAYLPTGGPSSTPVLQGNNANSTSMTAAIGALTKPCWLWMVVQWISTSPATQYICDDPTSGALGFRLSGTSVQILSGGAIGYTGTPLVFQAYGLTYGSSGSICSNAVSQVSGSSGTGTSTGIVIGSNASGSVSANCNISEIVIASVKPSDNVLSAYSQARYGFG